MYRCIECVHAHTFKFGNLPFITGACDSCYSCTLIILTRATVSTNSAVSCLAISLTDIVRKKNVKW